MINKSIPSDGTNSVISSHAELLEIATRSDIDDMLAALRYNWATETCKPDSKLGDILKRHNYLTVTDGRAHLTRLGKLFIGRLLLHFDIDGMGDEAFGTLTEKFYNFKVVSSGKNSIVATAHHKLLDTLFVLKIVRPGASTDLAKSMKLLNNLPPPSAIARPVDIVVAKVKDLLGSPVEVSVIVFPFVPGVTFSDFLHQSNHYLNSQIAFSFAQQVGVTLYALEQLGAYHGDLHEGNIIVSEGSATGVKFTLVDISFDAMGSLPLSECRNNDLQNFKQHLWRILAVQRRYLPRISVRKYVGTEMFQRLSNILGSDTKSFKDVVRYLTENDTYRKYLAEKSEFIKSKFATPPTFRLQRYEEITDPAEAVKLFVPYEPLHAKVRAFSNVFVSGNRGSGKSTYLASLAFFAEAPNSIVDFRHLFGVYFPCRQGEFRPLAAPVNCDPQKGIELVSNIIVIKVVRRVLELISGGVKTSSIRPAKDNTKLRTFIERFVPNRQPLIGVDHEIQSELENFVSTMVRVEMEAIACLADGRSPTPKLSPIADILDFLSLVREAYDELAVTQFHLLFDDAGVPYVTREMQQVICNLILTSNPLFCVKFSAEKFTFDLLSSNGKNLEGGQDYLEHDISQILFIGTGSRGLGSGTLEKYFRRIVEQRLEHFGYASTSIIDYVGDGQIAINELPNRLARQRKDAYYCGWTTIWNIADRTPRNLLEIVSEVFAVAEIDSKSIPKVVAAKDQDRAIRTISEKRFEALSQVAGVLSIGGRQTSLGRCLFVTTSAIGSTFRLYLIAEARSRRKRQHLAIERNDNDDLSPDADEVLRKLITFGVLDSTRTGFARDDRLKKPIYVLNRIYCPAFSIGYRRDDHLKLSRAKLELLLLSPETFMKEGTHRLKARNANALVDLFNYKGKQRG